VRFGAEIAGHFRADSLACSDAKPISNPAGFSVAGDDDLFALGFAQKPQKLCMISGSGFMPNHRIA